MPAKTSAYAAAHYRLLIIRMVESASIVSSDCWRYPPRVQISVRRPSWIDYRDGADRAH